MAEIIKALSEMDIIDAYFAEDALDALSLRLRDTNADAATIAHEARELLSMFDGKSIAGDSPLVLVDRARMIRDRAAARATLHELTPANSRTNAARNMRVASLVLGK